MKTGYTTENEILTHCITCGKEIVINRSPENKYWFESDGIPVLTCIECLNEQKDSPGA